ncbi:MAG TPA: hypothetical protein VE965_02990, partial [Gammaproteobacteria bacterium]|nr:hypothetical protein [Gammaproteobacteria bacterium]
DTFEDPVGYQLPSEMIPMRVMSVAMLMGRVVTCERRAEREKGGSSQAAFHRTPSLCICYVIWGYRNDYAHRLEGIGAGR